MKRLVLLSVLSLAACADTSEGTKKGVLLLTQAENACVTQAGGHELYSIPGRSQAFVECKIAAIDTYGKDALGIYQPYYQAETRKELIIATALDAGKISQQSAAFLTGQVQSQMFTNISAAKYRHMQQKQAEAEAWRARLQSVSEDMQKEAQQLNAAETPATMPSTSPTSYSLYRSGNSTVMQGSDGSTMTCSRSGLSTYCR
ncbi:hypothetical protein [Acetobacter malorum]|uniref:hypothetical protein n=1 Tax=Acetobacter malorum TaxID=178901 RepID=UPI000AAAA1CB|nr:hypothetical protein [Acetobacter malorum]